MSLTIGVTFNGILPSAVVGEHHDEFDVIFNSWPPDDNSPYIDLPSRQIVFNDGQLREHLEDDFFESLREGIDVPITQDQWQNHPYITWIADTADWDKVSHIVAAKELVQIISGDVLCVRVDVAAMYNGKVLTSNNAIVRVPRKLRGDIRFGHTYTMSQLIPDSILWREADLLLGGLIDNDLEPLNQDLNNLFISYQEATYDSKSNV